MADTAGEVAGGWLLAVRACTRAPTHLPAGPLLGALQVESVRAEMGEEVAALLEVVRRKSAKLADVEARLTGRLRWGVAMIQAKGELNTKRHIFAWWRCAAAVAAAAAVAGVCGHGCMGVEGGEWAALSQAVGCQAQAASGICLASHRGSRQLGAGAGVSLPTL